MNIIKERKILSVAGSRGVSAAKARAAAERVKAEEPNLAQSAKMEKMKRRYLGHFGTRTR